MQACLLLKTHDFRYLICGKRKVNCPKPKERERALTRGSVRRPRPLHWPTSRVRRGSAVSSSYCHVCGCRLPKSTPQDCPVCECSDIAGRRSPIDHRYCTECGMLYALSA